MREVSSVRLSWRLCFAAVAAVATVMALPAASGATMPGGNGRIAFQKFVATGESGELAVWSMNADGSGAAQLTKGKDSSEATYSPDGSRLAFGRYDELLIAAADGSNPRLLVAGSTKQPTAERWVANFKDPETGTVYPWVRVEERRIERDTHGEPSFSPDGTALAVAHYTSTEITEFVCSVNANNDPNCNGTYSNYFYSCESCGSSIEAIDANTGALRAIVAPKVSGVYLNAPSYSPTGSVAYGRDPEGPGEMQVLSVAAPGAPATILASGDVRDPDFSPDGSRVAFSSGNHGIGIVAATGGAATFIPVPPPLPHDKIWLVQRPVWSPDGQLIAFANVGAPGDVGLEPFTDGGVFLMRPDGSGLQLIHGDAAVPTGWQPLSLPPVAVRARAVKGKKKVRLSKKGIGVLGKVVCGSTPCSLKATGAKLKIGKKRFGVKVIHPKSLLPGATAKLKVKVKGKAMAALKARRGGKLKLKVVAAEGSGSMTLPFAAKLLPPKKHEKKRDSRR